MRGDFFVIFGLKLPLSSFSSLDISFYFSIKWFSSIPICVYLCFFVDFFSFCCRFIAMCFVIDLLQHVLSLPYYDIFRSLLIVVGSCVVDG